jgi:hypothetical protein
MASSNNCFEHTRGYPFLFLLFMADGKRKQIFFLISI